MSYLCYLQQDAPSWNTGPGVSALWKANGFMKGLLFRNCRLGLLLTKLFVNRGSLLTS